MALISRKTGEQPVADPEGACCGDLQPAALNVGTSTKTAETLRALGDPTRLGIMSLLANQAGPICVCDIVANFAQTQPTISHHLRILREAGLVDTMRRGTWAYYAIRPGALDTLIGALGTLRAAGDRRD